MMSNRPTNPNNPPNNSGFGPESGPYQGPSMGPGFDRTSSDLLRKLPPQSLDAEQAVLGGIFLHNSVFHTIVDIIQDEDFYSPAHRTIFQAIEELYRKNTPIDMLTVMEQLTSMGQLDQVGGTVYLAELGDSVVSAANAEFHAIIVRDKSIRRKLIEASSKIINSCYEGGETEALLDESEQAIFKISDSNTTKSYVSSKQAVDEAFTLLTQRYEQKTAVTGVPTSYTDFDKMTAGLQASDLIILAARPSMGKTALALNIGLRAAAFNNVATAVFSLEMSTEQLIQRMLCIEGRVDLSRVRSGYLDDEDWTGLQNAAQTLSEAPIFIDDTPALSTMELRARCRRLKSEKNLGLVIVDYLQLMRSSRKTDSRELEISDISRSLKALAKELDIPVIALAQLNRKVEERTDKTPMLSDLRESGAIEQDADVIVFLYRDEVYNKSEDNPKKGMAKIIIGKQRNGPVGDFELSFIKQYTKFGNLAATPYPSEYAGS